MLADPVVKSLSFGSEKDLDVLLVEPVMTAIMQDRLGDAVPVELAIVLVDRCELRVSLSLNPLSTSQTEPYRLVSSDSTCNFSSLLHCTPQSALPRPLQPTGFRLSACTRPYSTHRRTPLVSRTLSNPSYHFTGVPCQSPTAWYWVCGEHSNQSATFLWPLSLSIGLLADRRLIALLTL